ncbi:DUF6174 domain-containing protein [Deinococcus marmoris]
MLPRMKRFALLMALSCVACAEAGGADGGIPVGPAAQTCAPGYVRPDFARLEAELKTARALWKAAGIQNYSYDFARIAAPVRFPDVTVTVEGGRIKAVVSQGPLEQRLPEGLNVGPVEALFLEITRAITYQRSQPCADLRVTYSAADGHPTTSYSGSQFSPLADGNAEWRVTKFSARR